MKNVTVETYPVRPVLRVRLAGIPPRHGYGVQYVSGIDDPKLTEAGEWLSKFQRDGEEYVIEFGDNPLVWDEQQPAEDVCTYLREVAEIETQVRYV